MKLRTGLCLLLCLTVLGCAEDRKAFKPWNPRDFGKFSEISLEELDSNLSRKLIKDLNWLEWGHGYELYASKDHTSTFHPENMMADSRELYYISDLDPMPVKLVYRAESNKDRVFSLVDPGRNHSVENTRKDFYNISFTITAGAIAYEYETTQAVPREQQQMREFKPVFKRYSASNSMGLPRMKEAKRGSLSYTRLQEYKEHRITPQNIDRSGYTFRGDSIYYKTIGEPIYRLLNPSQGTMKTFSLAAGVGTFYYDKENKVVKMDQMIDYERIYAKNPPRTKSNLRSRYMRTDFTYSPQGILESMIKIMIENEDGVEKPRSKNLYTYQFSISENGYYRVEVDHRYSLDDPANPDKSVKKTIYFDEKMNWIHIKRVNGTENRWIEYAE